MSEVEIEETEAGEAGELEEPETEPEAPEGDDFEPEERAEPAEGDRDDFTPEEMDRRFDKVSKSFDTYKASIDRNLEHKALDLIGCPLCYPTPHPAFVNKGDIGNVPEEVEANVKMFLGYAREKEYQQAQGITECGECGGRGKVKTGSLVAEHATVTCPNCRGCGYMPPPDYLRLGQPTPTANPVVVAPPAEDLPQADRDNWGEPRVLPDGTLNDNYGKQPQFKTLHPVYGVTRDLTPQELVTGDAA